ncbi:Sybindin-like family-domain-containing protein [Copromyces sp. CBS 386.78]|nr:Sybindin-like family-domain-containing protein [Copromyces sp. CBS 386.78]
MTVFSLVIINKAGGLIYNRTFHEGGLNKLSTNDYLVLAGTFHGYIAPQTQNSVLIHMMLTKPKSVHAITARLNPVKSTPEGRPLSNSTIPGVPGGILTRPEPPSGLEVLESENFRLQCFNTLTGVKFLLFTDTTQTNVDVIIRRIYELYSDYVMKNPFYQLEMPIRCDMFDRKLLSHIREVNNR